MIVSVLEELILYPVADRGNPNSERIPILVKATTDMGCFGLMIGESRGNGLAAPFHDNLFWFGDGILNAGDWILLYTGSGTPTIYDWNDPPGSKVYSVHWGKKNTLFANSMIVPVLFRTDSLVVGSPPIDLPQLSAPTSNLLS